MTTIQTRTHLVGTREAEIAGALSGLADWLRLAAAPSFAAMALLTCIFGDGPQDMFCTGMQHASPLSGMTLMYVLMSAFHAGPWLKLVASWASSALRS